MIHMPQRSVTRFFIPLIDVLLLLFCIFLLMPMVAEEDQARSEATKADLSLTVKMLQRDLKQSRQTLEQYDKLKPELENVAKLKEELERLRKAAKQSLQQRAFFQIIDIDGKDGSIYFYDPANPKQPTVKLPDEIAVRSLIKRHQNEAKGRELYYYFMYPRPQGGYPTFLQVKQYQQWFGGVANSLKENEP